jgi:myo-inositol-1(or 4)-monophosphatase
MGKSLAEIEVVKAIVVEAGKRALTRWGSVQAEKKADLSLVTAVDRETEQFVERELSRLYPGYAFVGEEYGWRGPEDAPVWACDPIDGTTNFVVGMPHWCVSVGLVDNGIPMLGAIYLPVLDELFWAVRGEGAFCNGTRLQARDRDDLEIEDTLCMTSNSLKTLTAEAIPGRLRCLGSIAAELAYTARGSLCATVGLHEGIVDIAAALCLCLEAGCQFRYLRGPQVDIGALVHAQRTTEHFVCGPPRLIAYLQKTLRVR